MQLIYYYFVHRISLNYLYIKRMLDIIFSVFMLVILFPFMLIIGALICLTSKGPALYKQKRLGLRGQSFYIYKFRTMVVDAEQRLKLFTAEQIAEYQKCYKLKNDPRITHLGKFLRRTSIDEIPQFVNVIKGDMSIIGPRPITLCEHEKFGQNLNLLLSVRPGITGLAQVGGRNDISFYQRMILDMEYIHKMSLSLDCSIFLRTLYVIIAKKGAY